MAERIALVGGGAAGTLVAIHAIRRARTGGRSLEVTVIEPRPDLGAGIAYSTTAPEHRLNVRAEAMSAYPDEPADFMTWAELPPSVFAPRGRFAEYLRACLARELTAAGEAVAFRHVADRVTDVSRGDDRWTVTTSEGEIFVADHVVLATGNVLPEVPAWAADITGHERFVTDPWTTGEWAPAHGDTVLAVGTGLTFVDLGLDVLATPGVNVIGVSRRGTLPAPHAPCAAVAEVPELRTPRDVIRWIREAGDGWRGAIDGLRPLSSHTWRSFTDEQQAQFLRHAMRFWDAHRHRMAPEAASQLDAHQRSGRLRIVAARVTGARTDSPRALSVELSDGATVLADWLVLCTGPSPSALLRRTPVASLIAQGVAVPGPHGLGLSCDPTTGALIDAHGRASESMWTIGPLRRGVLWETTAIREIREQAMLLAGLLVGTADTAAALTSSR
jgi:uncharacterized NAD(P)/FAD-binding protein YdhS